MKIAAIYIVICFLAGNVHCQTTNDTLLKENINLLYSGYNTLSVNILQDAINNLNNIPWTYQRKWLCHYYISHGYYMQAIYFFNRNRNAKVKEKLEIALEHCDSCLNKKNDFADGLLLKANIYKLQGAINPQMMGSIGGIDKIIDHAILLEKDNPRIYLSKGLFFFFTPVFQGGNTDSAKYYLLKSESLFDSYKPSSIYYPSWGHEEVFAWLGQIAAREGKMDIARKYYNKALEINPKYYWVSKQLIPQLDEAPKNKTTQLISIGVILLISILLFLGFILYNSLFKKQKV